MHTSGVVRRLRWAFEVAYVAAPTGLAVVGNEHQFAGWFLAAAAVSWPCGLIGFVGVYVGYAIISAVGGIFVSTTTSDGSDAWWLSTSLDVLRVTSFAAAAVVNVLLLELWLRRRAAKKTQRNAPAMTA